MPRLQHCCKVCNKKFNSSTKTSCKMIVNMKNSCKIKYKLN